MERTSKGNKMEGRKKGRKEERTERRRDWVGREKKRRA
jgi:hypothetical protein